MGKSFCGVPYKHTQDWAVNNHMLQTGLSFAENFCNKTPKKFSKICQNLSYEVKETLEFFPRAVPDQRQCRPRFSISGSNLIIVLYEGSIFISTLLRGY